MNDKHPSETPAEPKIIIDEDWKSQVEKEKEELKKSAAGNEPVGDKKSAPVAENASSLPPVSFSMLVSTLATQAMVGLGLLPDPLTEQPTVNPPLAKHFIDTLAMLEEKTRNNLTDQEAAHIRDGLHQLRMIYLSTPAKPPKTGEPGQSTKSAIELP